MLRGECPLSAWQWGLDAYFGAWYLSFYSAGEICLWRGTALAVKTQRLTQDGK